jgi:DNA ligase-1
MGQQDLRALPLHQRVNSLNAWFAEQPYTHLHLSCALPFSNANELNDLRERANTLEQGYIEGLMLKRKDADYVSGRPKGKWYKWKRDPKLIDAVIMYAQRGHGKRSSFYSDYTFGCWQGEQLLPIGKAYSGFTDAELKLLDNWVRKNTMGRFGPVKEVKKELVFEVAFDSVHSSNRHKSGLALRFPRIHRIRWDKPAKEADLLSTLKAMI